MLHNKWGINKINLHKKSKRKKEIPSSFAPMFLSLEHAIELGV